MIWSPIFKGGVMPDGTVEHFETWEEYEEAYRDALNGKRKEST